MKAGRGGREERREVELIRFGGLLKRKKRT